VMLVRARDFGKRAGSSPEPAPFVGSKLCGECHGKIFSEQQGASRHALTLRFGSGLKDVPLPERPVPDPIVPSITHGFSRKQDDRIELESRAGDQVFKAVVAYAVGSGRHGMTMLATDEQGIVRELRVSYFAEKASWGETKGINFAPREASDHIGLGLSSQGVHHCLQCHTTWFRSIDQNRSGTRGPEGQDRGIGCERCHGPGLNHVKAVRSGFPELAIALTSKAPSSVRLKSCAECHAADGSIPLNDPEFTRAQGTTFLFSRCYTAMKDQFGCTTCHDPHRSVETSTLHYEVKCLTCHGSVAQRLSGASSSRVDDDTGRPNAPSCPVNATAKCISCHMPKVDDPSRRSHFTDHHIRVHRTAASKRPSL
jgi:predicted CXXCH cytochrome family protein